MSRVSARDVLPDRRPPRPSLHALPGRHRDRRPSVQLFTRVPRRGSCSYVDFVKRVVPLHDDLFDFFYEALPGYEEVGRRRVLLACWGSFQDPDDLRLRLPDHERSGAATMYVTPGRRRRRRAASRPTSSTSTSASASCSGSSFYDDWEDGETFVTHGSARQPGRPAPSVEPDDDPAPAAARLRGHATPG